jgi:hypothetical protein
MIFISQRRLSFEKNRLINPATDFPAGAMSARGGGMLQAALAAVESTVRIKTEVKASP